MYQLFSCMLTKVDHYKLSSCRVTPFIIMFVHFIFNKCINLFDFLFLFNPNFENAKDWFCASPFTTVNIISCHKE